MVKGVFVFFEGAQTSKRGVRALFLGNWTGREVAIAERAMQRWYRATKTAAQSGSPAGPPDPEVVQAIKALAESQGLSVVTGEELTGGDAPEAEATGNESTKEDTGEWNLDGMQASGSDSTSSASQAQLVAASQEQSQQPEEETSRKTRTSRRKKATKA